MTQPSTSTVFDWLLAKFPDAKRTTLREMVSAHRVLLNGATVKSLKQPVEPTDKITFGEAAPAKVLILDEGLRLLHQDADVLIVEKPVGLLTSTHDDEPRPTAVAILDAYVQKSNHKNRALLVHRLDRDASGLLVFARTPGAFDALKSQFAAHTITRRYDVLVHGYPSKTKARLENILTEDARGRVQTTTNKARGQVAILDYELVASVNNRSHLRCTLYTGRKHQIRVQLQSIGHPVCGDPVYGVPAARTGDDWPHRMALHATHLAFTHPRTKKIVSFDSPAPKAFNLKTSWSDGEGEKPVKFPEPSVKPGPMPKKSGHPRSARPLDEDGDAE